METYRYDYFWKRYYKHCTVRAGEDGVTQEMIDFLYQSDNEMRRMENKAFYYTDKLFEKSRNDYYRYEENLFSHHDSFDSLSETNMFNRESIDPIMEDCVREAVNQLPKHQQDLLYSFYGLNITQAAIGRECGVTKQAIYSRLQTALHRIEKLLSE